MRRVVRIEREDNDDELNTDSGPICIEHSGLEDATELGLTLEDGKRIMAFLQEPVVTAPVQAP
jgi:hypothetical protein